MPATEADAGDARKEVDRRLLFGPDSALRLPADARPGLDALRRLWCAEPSVTGKT